jgi:hypothetical protein
MHRELSKILEINELQPTSFCQRSKGDGLQLGKEHRHAIFIN